MPHVSPSNPDACCPTQKNCRRWLHPRWLTALMILLLTAALPAITQPALADTGPTDEDTDKTDPEARWDALMKVLAVTFSETQELLATSPAIDDNLGQAVSLEGNVALVGAPQAGVGPGVVYVFEFSLGSWSQVATLTASDGLLDDQFGFSVSLSGTRALVGARGDDGSFSGEGSVYVFDRPGASWSGSLTETTKFTATVPAVGGAFGTSVSLDGVFALVGEPFAAGTGQAHVIDVTTVLATQVLVPSAVGFGVSLFGRAVSLDGGFAAIGAFDDGSGSLVGAAYVWELVALTWTEKSQLTPSSGGAFLDEFGISVSMDGGGARVLVGSSQTAFGGGTAYIFDNPGPWPGSLGTVTETDVLAPTVASLFGDQFGASVSLSGNVALVGAPSHNAGVGALQGAAYAFEFDLVSMWPQADKLTSSDAVAGDQFGTSVSLDGSRALLGAPLDDNNNARPSQSGTAYVFDAVMPNNPPMIAADNPMVVVNEGVTANNTGTFSDPDGDPLTLTESIGTVMDNGGGIWSWSFPTADGPAESQMVTITADDGALTANATFMLVVNNVAPTVTAVTIPVAPVDIDDQPVTASGTFTDPAGVVDAPFTCTVDYGDGGGPQAGTVVGFGCNGPNQTYSDPGVYTVTVTVTDKDNDSGSLSTTGFLVIFDPNDGFVTGGGFVDSPAAACPTPPNFCGGASGTANFGFNAKYKKNSTEPMGQTEFNFQEGGINFHSDEYSYLTVSGALAVYAGTGTINGAGSFDFLVSVIDEKKDPAFTEDMFRIRIKDGATVLYDNNLACGGGTGDNDIPCTDLTGGQIVIHNKGNKRGDSADPAAVAEELPKVFALEQNYPNPFNPATTIAFDLPEASEVQLVVFDVMGRQIATLVNGAFSAGRHEVTWQVGTLPSGTYFYRITAGDFVLIRQMVLLK